MAAYNGASKRIKNALVTMLQGLTYDTGGGEEPAFQSVRDNTQQRFEGYPALTVLPGDVTTEKESTRQNLKAVAYLLTVHLQFENTPESESAAYDQMYDLTDILIDKLDAADAAGELHTIDGGITTHILNATRGDWYLAPAKSGVILLCDVNVELRYTQNH